MLFKIQGLLLRDKPETLNTFLCLWNFFMFMVLKKKLWNQMHILRKKKLWLIFQTQFYILEWDSVIFI